MKKLRASVDFLINSIFMIYDYFFLLVECSDLRDENIFVLKLDLLERSSHEEKTRTAIERYGRVSLSTTGS